MIIKNKQIDQMGLSRAGMPEVKIKGFALVRDRNGKPKIDGDPEKLHQSIIDAMTAEEFETAKAEWKRKLNGTKS